MFESLIRKATPILLTLFTLSLTVGTVFAQEGEESSSTLGLTLFVLLLGIGFIGLIFLTSWSQSQPDDTDQ